jgi:two-component system sensor histidine kinase KdpD
LVGYTFAVGAVVLVSFAIAVLPGGLRIANISMLYLIAILATAVAFGSGPAVVASVLAVLIFDWFFVEPIHQFTVADPQEWVALLLFLATAVVTGQLAAGQRRRAEEAKHREREAVVLYDVARLLAGADLRPALAAVAERLRSELLVDGVAIELAEVPGGPVSAGDSAAWSGGVTSSPAQLLREGTAPTADRRAGPGHWVAVVPPASAGIRARITRQRVFVVPVVSGAGRRGTITIAPGPKGARFGPIEIRLLSAVAAHIGQALERDQLRREATDAEVLRRSDELKTALLNAVSHDLRTPLASILASAGSLRQDDVTWTPQDRSDFVETIEHEAERLNAIIGNLLDLSRVESGILRPEKGWYDLGAIVDDVLGRLRALTARHRVLVDIPEDLPPVELDYIEIDQVLSNLIENAVKYVPPGKEIEITARRVDSEIEVAVADRGPGIPPASLPRLFDAFYRGEAGRSIKGSGLGLAVAKGLIGAHGGRIWAENRSGGGTRFVFTLPLGEAANVTDRPGR